MRWTSRYRKPGGACRVTARGVGQSRAASPQLALELDSGIDSGSDAALRAAFLGLQIAKRISFEEAIASVAWRICLRNLAEAAARDAVR